ncbi:glycine/betaine ABC transporter permease [Nocardioides baekrokdamisoli]|uniref:Glycine/betaine ABC transporter permease n=1 Tax=Nocardioides baekrokdamisoli TaxID=1804624 RepID=A0A3G9IWZ8_9ACTN|nr:ABC transporter permease subunit [Nocardioides baekrokdamisoli]BBH15788.1 glycine/betaine ABC transporter permease [Nocardioides baekrokdamisoli]
MSALGTLDPASKEEQPLVVPEKKRRTGLKLAVILAVWLVGWLIFRGTGTLSQPFAQLNGFDTWLNHIRDNIQAASLTNWFFHGVLGQVSTFVNWLVTQAGQWISHPAGVRPVPQIGWLGVLGIATWVTYLVAGVRSTVLVAVSFFLFAWLGFWASSMDLLIVTAIAVVASLLVGIPTGIVMARSRTVSGIITPILDAMQTMPSFCYLLPIFMLFGPGATCAVVLTVIYSLPPLVRITEHGIRSVSPTTIEAARSLGVTRSQLLRQVQLPMARRTIVLGINQCTLAALSMAVIAAYVNGPGLGIDVLSALNALNVGQAAVPGLLIVVMAIMLDRTTTAVSERTGRRIVQIGRTVARPGLLGRVLSINPVLRRRIALCGGVLVVAMMIYLSRSQLDYAKFQDSWTVGGHLSTWINDVTNNVVSHIDKVTLEFKNAVSYGALNPLQNVLANSPWWLVAPIILALSFVIGGLRPLVISAVCEGVIFGVGLWNDAMVTLTSVLVATALTMILAIIVGVWMGRNRRAEVLVRPILDAFQTIPPFVYLVPALALFGPTRFTAIVAGIAYAAPIAIKLVTDGILGVPETIIEAARSNGVTSWQMIRKVQLPMARPSLVLAANQGLLYVLSMVVIGGMVGAGSLGYIVVSGSVQGDIFGKGVAAGIAIIALGIMLDRIAKSAVDRQKS